MNQEFKVGDKVKCLRFDPSPDMEGMIGVVTGTSKELIVELGNGRGFNIGQGCENLVELELLERNTIGVEVKLGDRVRSSISGFSGVATAKCEYLHGNPQIQVTSTSLVDGEEKSKWFAASELVSND